MTETQETLIARYGQNLSIVPSGPAAITEPDWVTTFSRGTRKLRRPKPDCVAPFPEEEQDYIDQCLQSCETDVRIYTVPSHPGTKIVVPEEYAAALDELRRLRVDAEKFDDARARWSEHPLRHRARPEDLVAHLDELPDSSFIAEIVLLDWDNAFDPWLQQIRDNNNVTLAAAIPGGIIELYRAEMNGFIGITLNHEWCHLLQSKFTALIAEFRNMVNGEWWEWSADPSAKQSMGEQFAYTGQQLMHRDASIFISTALAAPLRSFAIFKSIELCLSAVPAERRSRFHDKWAARAKFVREHIRPVAMEKSQRLTKTAEQIAGAFKN
jgi:hypothetical protein